MPKADKRFEVVRGEVEILQGRIRDAVRNGLPDAGWRGDKLLEVCFNRTSQMWEVWDTAPSPPRLAVSKPYDGLRDLDVTFALCRKLAEADAPARTVYERSENFNRAAREQRERAAQSRRLDVARELGEAIRFDLRHD